MTLTQSKRIVCFTFIIFFTQTSPAATVNPKSVDINGPTEPTLVRVCIYVTEEEDQSAG